MEPNFHDKKQKIKNDLKKEFPNRYETLGDVISRREKYIYSFFKILGLEIRLIGNPNTPAFLLNEERIISVYVHNFDLIFTDKPFDSTELFRFKLSENSANFKNKATKKKIIDIINSSESRTVFKIRYNDLYLSGYTFKGSDKTDKTEMYPVFSKINPKVYFEKSSAEEIVEKYKDYYDLVIE